MEDNPRINPEKYQYLAAIKKLSRLALTDSHSRQKRLQKPDLSVEMILRKTFIDTLMEYGSNCSLAGVQKMCDPAIGIWERLIRIVVFLTAIATVCYFLLYIWSDTLNRPLIVTMESATYPISEIDFPAVALCNVNRISKKALRELAEEEYHDLAKNKESIEEVEAMLMQWGRLLDFSFNESLRKNLIYNNMIEKYLHDTDRITAIMKRLAPSCIDQLMVCLWEGDPVECSTIFSLRRTSFGHCCTFNFMLDYDTIEKSIKPLNIIKRQNEAGYVFGLNVVLDPMLDDYAYPLSMTLGFDVREVKLLCCWCLVLVFNSMHFADSKSGRVTHRKAEPNKGVFLQLKATKQIASREIRKYSLQTRKCLFHNEMPDTFGDLYSYSSCLVFCRVKTIQTLCKCIPYFAAAGNAFEGPMCTLDNLKCLNKYREKLSYLYPTDVIDPRGLEMEIQDSLFCQECYPDCELTSYATKSYETSLQGSYDISKNFRNLLFATLNMTDKVALSVYYPNYDAALERLDVVNYWYEILSSVGGFGGIVIGFSIISVVEVVYFFTIRFSHHFYVNYLEFH